MKHGRASDCQAAEIGEHQAQQQRKYATGYHHKVQRVLARMQRKHKPRTGTWGLEHSDSAPHEESTTKKEELRSLSCQAMYHTQPELRLDALRGLLYLSPYDEISITTLERVAADRDPAMRAAAVAEMKQFPAPLPEALLKQMILCIWDADHLVRKAAAKAARKHPDPRLLAPLMGLLGTSDNELRTIVQQSLRAISEALGPAPTSPHADA